MLGELLFNQYKQGNKNHHNENLKSVLVKHKDCFYPKANLYYLQQNCPILILSTLTLRTIFMLQYSIVLSRVPFHCVPPNFSILAPPLLISPPTTM
eukprot:sb/3479130/